MKKTVLSVFIFTLSILSMQSQTRVWDMGKLNNARNEKSIEKDYVLQQAHSFLTKDIPTIVDKDKIAPSGDKHDYFSCAPYWWPDPANPTGPYIRKDGETNRAVTTPDKKNLGTLTNSVVYLSLGYYLTSDEKYATKAVENLRAWFMNPETKMNPNLNYGQTIYGHFGGKGRGAGMIETYKFVDLLEGIELLKKSTAFTKNDQQGLTNWFGEYLNWMLTSPIGKDEYKTKNNHGTAFEVQATRIALFVGKEDVARKFITEFAARRIFTQIEPDGKQPFELVRTKALGYSTFNLTHLLDMCAIAKTLDIDLYPLKSADGRSISKGLEYVSQFIGKPQSNFPYKQIVDWDEVQDKLCLQLYRADKYASAPIFKKYYINKQNGSKNDYNYIVF
ncbi:MAG: alginate lyase family protein [Paludibacter sp.]|nr:alginate lyase family protein [Paludibacter sp.]